MRLTHIDKATKQDFLEKRFVRFRRVNNRRMGFDTVFLGLSRDEILLANAQIRIGEPASKPSKRPSLVCKTVDDYVT